MTIYQPVGGDASVNAATAAGLRALAPQLVYIGRSRLLDGEPWVVLDDGRRPDVRRCFQLGEWRDLGEAAWFRTPDRSVTLLAVLMLRHHPGVFFLPFRSRIPREHAVLEAVEKTRRIVLCSPTRPTWE